MTAEEATDQGINIVVRVSRTFHRSNRTAYSKLVMAEEDLAGYLYETVLFKKYIPLVTEQPDFYTQDTFGRSLFVACHKAMLSHVKKYITSQKRGNILAHGVAVELNREVTENLLPEVSKNAENRLLGDVRRLSDQNKDPVVQRALILLSRECYTSKTQLKARLNLAPSRFEQVWKTIQILFADFGPAEKTPSIYEPLT